MLIGLYKAKWPEIFNRCSTTETIRILAQPQFSHSSFTIKSNDTRLLEDVTYLKSGKESPSQWNLILLRTDGIDSCIKLMTPFMLLHVICIQSKQHSSRKLEFFIKYFFNCGFNHSTEGNSEWKTSFFVQLLTPA